MFTQLKEARKVLGNRHLRDVHLKTVDAVDRLKTCETDVIRCLQEVDSKLVYRYLGYGSLFRYCVEGLRLSEHQSYAFITVARKSVEIPKLQAAIESGELSVFKAVRLSAVINKENQDEWIDLAIRLTKKELEKKIAAVNPRASIPESAEFLNDKTVAVKFPISEENYLKLKRAQDLLCQNTGRAVSLEETVANLAEFFLTRKDPLKKAERAKVRTEKRTRTQAESSPTGSTEKVRSQTRNSSIDAPESQEAHHRATTETPLDIESLGPGRESKSKRRRALKAEVKHALNLRDEGRCQHRMPDGSLCSEQRWLQFHHRVEVCNGGSDDLDNLTTLCRAHHMMRH